MKTRNATTVINLIDAHLRRVLNIRANYGHASLDAAVNAAINGEYRDKVLDGTFGQTINARLHFAKQKGDAFAAAILVDNPCEANNRWSVLTAILDARRCNAHGTERANDVITRDAKLYGCARNSRRRLTSRRVQFRRRGGKRGAFLQQNNATPRNRRRLLYRETLRPKSRENLLQTNFPPSMPSLLAFSEYPRSIRSHW